MRIDISSIVNNGYYDLDILEPVLACTEPVSLLKLSELITFCAYGTWHGSGTDRVAYVNCLHELLFLGSQATKAVDYV